MVYCPKCGEQLNDDANFCQKCGQTVSITITKTAERKIVYEGEVHKCPSCGTDLPSFTAICPGCGHEINSQKISPDVKEFIEKIADYDKQIANSQEKPKNGWNSWSKYKKIMWIFLNMCTLCIPLIIYLLFPILGINKMSSLTFEERQKALFIRNSIFPNDREIILEVLLFIKSQVSFLSSGKINRSTVDWIRIWTQKATQMYQKAEILFQGDEISNNTYRDIVAINKKCKKTLFIRLIVSIASIIIFAAIMLVFINNIFISKLGLDSKYYWHDYGLYLYLPKPNNGRGKILSESDEEINIELYKATYNDFEEYINKCRENGFTNHINKTHNSFYAYNEELYYLTISYNDVKRTILISLNFNNDITEFINGYEQVDFFKMNSPAEENGLGGKKVYMECTINNIETLENEIGTFIFCFAVDNQQNVWLVGLNHEMFKTVDYYKSIIGKKIILKGEYQGYSEVYKMPAIYLDELLIEENNDILFGIGTIE